ncbi:lipocalin family protein [Marivirga sp. S37H4]|uniref:Lipocalin family protein n=1 Tax=Marivirga aurantiaca TaxID=2802615 RepID=A0A934WZ16_9BACT|nr:lipocalin family protein [Marivirga aurantiaca]MBK6265400.1 lipocalin family protein [Marivirga aurantiaca]
MKNLYSLLFIFLIISFITACTLERQLPGTWQIASYSEEGVTGRSTSATNVGTIEFDSDGTGTNDLEFKIFGSKQTDQREFTYDIGDNYITIKPQQENDSSSVKSWIVMENKRNSQKWKSTDDEGNVQTIELKKED